MIDLPNNNDEKKEEYISKIAQKMSHTENPMFAQIKECPTRLTEFYNEVDYDDNDEGYYLANGVNSCIAVQKLGKLEDLMQDFGFVNVDELKKFLERHLPTIAEVKEAFGKGAITIVDNSPNILIKMQELASLTKLWNDFNEFSTFGMNEYAELHEKAFEFYNQQKRQVLKELAGLLGVKGDE